MFFHAHAIYVCENKKILYFCSDEIEKMKDLHHPHHSFLNQEQKHRYIDFNNLTHVTTLANLIYFSENSHILANAKYFARG